MTKRLGPGDIPQGQSVRVIHGGDDGLVDDDPDRDDLPDVIAEMTVKLQGLREPFPDNMIEKLPKPLWKNAWTDQPKGHCEVCHGYHPLANTIHLDYVGHANTTNRLLEVDPFWEWEPMAYTEAGTPLFSDGGLWIKLTVCGVTRLGFGDGGSVKEVIGDAIRNAAMRFGVALDLWSKIDLHAERNPGDGPTRNQPRDEGTRGRSAPREAVGTQGGVRNTGANPPRATNQDALDELLSICNQNGLDPRAVEATYNEKYGPPELVKASPDDIRNYGAIILDQLEGPNDAGSSTAGEDSGGTEPVPADTSDEAQAGPPVQGESEPEHGDGAAVGGSGSDPTDTSDVEKGPGDAF